MEPFSTFALLLEYDGEAFSGSQYQANARTVQAELERSFAPLGLNGRVAFAGRTDAGVHAIGQVAAVRVPCSWTAAALMKAANALLAVDVSVRGAVQVPPSFDPRRSASSRRYRYRVLIGPVRSPLLRRTSWHVRHELDNEAIRGAAAALIGEHDFAAFGGPLDHPGLSTVRRMLDVTVRREGIILELEFEATAFLPHQVRRTVGALVQVGRRTVSNAAFVSLLDGSKPGAAGPAAPGHALTLLRVSYDGIEFEVDETG